MNASSLHENGPHQQGLGASSAAAASTGLLGIASSIITPELKRGRGRPKKVDDRYDNQKHGSTANAPPKQYPCDWPHCGMWFTQSSNLNKHYLTHTNEKPFKCLWPNCDKSFKQSSNLNKHRLVHTGEKPFSCDYPECNKRFSQSSNLKKHKLVHSGDKPYRCDFPGCTKMFDQSSNLNKHYLTHVGQKPHACGECGDKFSQSSNLAKHMRQKHGHYPGPQQSAQQQQQQSQLPQHQQQSQLSLGVGGSNFRLVSDNSENAAAAAVATSLSNGLMMSSSTASAVAAAAAAIEAGGGRLVVLPNAASCYPPGNGKNLPNDLSGLSEMPNAVNVVAVAANAFFSNATHSGKLNFDGLDTKFISAHNFLPMSAGGLNNFVTNTSGQQQSSHSQVDSLGSNNHNDRNSLPMTAHHQQQQQQQHAHRSHYEDNANGLDLEDGGGGNSSGAIDDPNRFLSLKLSIGNSHDDS